MHCTHQSHWLYIKLTLHRSALLCNYILEQGFLKDVLFKQRILCWFFSIYIKKCSEKNSWRQKLVEAVSLSWWVHLSVTESLLVMSIHFWIMRFLNFSNDQRAFAPCLRCLCECLFASDSDGPLQHCFTVTGYGVWDSFVQRRPCECAKNWTLKKKMV